MMFIDTHTHLYLEEFDADRDAVVHKAIQNGVENMFLPNIDSGSVHGMLDLARRFPENCFPMIGLHPTSVKSDYMEELAFIEKELTDPEKHYFAVGEVGVDLYWSTEFKSNQMAAFSFQLDLAVKYYLPVVIHTRNSFEEAIKVIEEKKNPAIRGIFHCFGGNLAQAERAIQLGFFLGIGGVITYKNSGLQKVIEAIGIEHLVLETDAPFLPPVPHRGKRNESAYIPLIAEKIAEITKVDIEEVASITTKNARALFWHKA
jgi:TatD DNase family protein